MGYVVGWCDACGKLLESEEPDNNDWNGDVLHRASHYLCSECIRKIIDNHDKEIKED